MPDNMLVLANDKRRIIFEAYQTYNISIQLHDISSDMKSIVVLEKKEVDRLKDWLKETEDA